MNMFVKGFFMKNFFRFLVTCALGVLFHFVYDWTGENAVVGLFTPINESTWEHLKLLFFPMVLVAIIEVTIMKKPIYPLLPARMLGILSGMAFIVVVFYTFWGVTGRLIDFVNITIYIFAVWFAYVMESCFANNRKLPAVSVGWLILIVFTMLFVVFTINQPEWGIFRDLSFHPK